MKSDEDVRMISAEAPVLFARACEFFIQELTTRSWAAAQEFKRRTMQRSDVATAISRTGGGMGGRQAGRRCVV
jgi:nuclear transcription factor Y gamma